MKVKKLVALVVALTMVLSLIVLPSTTASTALDPYSMSKADYSLVYMGKVPGDDEYLEQYPEASKPIEELNVGDSFWVGVQFSNMSRIKDMFEKSGNAGGVLSLTFRISYDQTYLSPHEYADQDTMFNDNTYLNTVYPTFQNGRKQDPMYSVNQAEYTNPDVDTQNNETLVVNNPKDVKMIIRLTSNTHAQDVARYWMLTL